MKAKILFSMIAIGIGSLHSEAKEVRAYVCHAHCLLASSDPSDISFQWIESFPFRTRSEAFAHLNRVCRQKGDSPIAAVTGSLEELSISEEEERVVGYRHGVSSEWTYDGYREYRKSGLKYHYFRKREISIRALPLTEKTVPCTLSKVEESELGTEFYQGSRPVGG